MTVRELTEGERTMLDWLAHNPTSDTIIPLHELVEISVAAQCPCGCASIDFAIKGVAVEGSGMQVVADYLYISEQNNLNGCFLFLVNGHIAGIEVWSVDGGETPAVLPPPEKLYRFDC